MINGVESILIVDNCILLGSQNINRWKIINNELCAPVKTIGGKIEKNDLNDLATLFKEIKEEILGIEELANITRISNNITIPLSKLNCYEQNSNIILQANFYSINITKYNNI